MAESEDKAIENPEDPFGFGKKKKKKKNKDLNAELEGEATSATPAPGESAVPSEDLQNLTLKDGEKAQTGDNIEEPDFTGLKKKDKKKVVFIDDQAADVIQFEASQEAATKADQQKLMATDTQSGWQGSERDYTYDELLLRVFNIMREKNPDMITGEKKKFIMKPPQVARVGTKKTSFSNFADICRLLRRQEKHLLVFLLAELGTSGSLDSNNQLTIKGRFSQRHIESVLRKYIKEYIICPTCRSPDTVLVKEERIFFLQCETCRSRCAVASIKSGFQAQVVKRAAQRARAT